MLKFERCTFFLIFLEVTEEKRIFAASIKTNKK